MKLVNESGLEVQQVMGSTSTTLFAKGTFQLQHGTAAVRRIAQLPAGEADFVPFKPRTDLLFSVKRPGTVRVGRFSKSGSEFGPVDITDSRRRARLGTYDKKWLKARWPGFPEDFDPRFNNSAPDDQQLEGYLRGDEPIRFEGLHPHRAVYESRLPGIRVRALQVPRVLRPVDVPMNLDTLWADVEQELLILVWRGLVELRPDDALVVIAEPLGSPRPIPYLVSLLDAPESEEELPSEPLPETPPLDFAQQDLSGRDFSGEMFSGADFRGARLVGTNLCGAMLDGCDLRDADLSGADLSSADFTEAKLSGAKLAHAVGEGALFSGADLRRADLSGARLSKSDFSRATMHDAVFSGAKLDDAVFENCAGNRVKAAGADLRGLRAAGARLGEADFHGADATGSLWQSAKLWRADFREAKLRDAEFEEAYLPESRLDRADLRGARMAKCHLRAVEARTADLFRVSLRGADLTRADLRNSNLFEADLFEARLDCAQLDGALRRTR